jgi:hypothetical protein
VISEEEKRNARADLRCKRSTGLLGTWLAADIAYQHAIIEREGERLRDYGRIVEKVVEISNRIIAAG